VRVVLREKDSDRIRVSDRAKKRLEAMAKDAGCGVWRIVDDLLGVE
jgi:hypothetical protein